MIVAEDIGRQILTYGERYITTYTHSTFKPVITGFMFAGSQWMHS